MAADDIIRAIEGLADRDLLVLTEYISSELRDRVRVYRVVDRMMKERELSRLTEKLALAAAVAPKHAARIEARADKIIAVDPEMGRLTDEAFQPHEALLDEAQKGLDDLKHQLATMSNMPPLSVSDDSPKDTEVTTETNPCPSCAMGSAPVKRPDTGEWVHTISVQGRPGITHTICTNPPTDPAS